MGRSSYSGLHAAKAKSGPAAKVAPAIKPMMAQRPLCGASAFDMLREHDAKIAAQNAPLIDQFNDAADSAVKGADQDSLLPSPIVADDNEMESFMMPPVSDGEDSMDGDYRDRPADFQVAQPDVPSGRGRSMPAAAASGSSSAPVRRPSREAAAAPESAADYVERVKKSMGVAAPGQEQETDAEIVPSAPARGRGDAAPPPRAAVAGTAVCDVPVPAPPARSRSSDPRAAVAAVRAADSAANASANVRSHSSDPRASPKFAKRPSFENVASPDDDSDDDDNCGQASRGNVSKPGGDWKLDVRSMVKDFAREERARTGAAPARPGDKLTGSKAPGPSRPPKAPPAAPEPQRSVFAPEPQPLKAQENLPPEEQLFFSRKPREVDYVPASLDDFKQKGYGNKEKQELGKLGPDLDDDDLLMKRAKQEQNKQFSKELLKINQERHLKQRMNANRKDAKPDAKPKPEPTARQKAQEFARNVPKPKLPAAAKPPVLERKVKEAQADTAREAEKDQADWDEIRRREKQHAADVLRVKDIKDFLGQLPC